MLLHPFLPNSTKQIGEALSLTESEWGFGTLESWGFLNEGREVKKPAILFQKYETEEEKAAREAKKQQKAKAKEKKKEKKGGEKKPKEEKKDDGFASFDDFLKVEIKVVKILSAERVEGSDKLLKLSIDAGEPEPRTVAAGIGKFFAPEDIVGLHVAAVTNLKPRKVFGIPSQAMLVAAETTEGGLELTRYTDKTAPGSRIG